MTIVIHTDDNFKTLGLHEPVSATEADWAQEHLADLPVLVSMAEKPIKRRKVKHWQDAQGRWWRKPGSVVVTWEEGTAKRFRIWLNKGANEADLVWLQRVVSEAKEGRFGPEHGWTQNSPESMHPRAWAFRWSRPADGPIEGDRRPAIAVCDDTACRETVHWKDDLVIHTAEVIDGPKWTVSVEHFDDSPWSVYVDLREDNLSVAEAASFASDIQWATAEAKKLNEARSDA